jgi:hypothetical protein
VWRAALCSVCVVLAACERQPADGSPEKVVESFIERMRSVHGDPAAGRRAVELLWSKGRENLEERARRATAAAGRSVAPEEMLVPSRFSLRFEPARSSAETRGDWSRVTLFGQSPQEVAEVHCVKEEGQWRVVLDMPPLPDIEKRQ